VISPVVHHIAVLVCCVGAWRLLSTGQWTWRAPRLGVALWQLFGFAALTSVLGLPLQVALAPYDAATAVALWRATGDVASGRVPAELGAARLVLAAVTVGGAAAALAAVVGGQWRAVRQRRRHVDALSLVARRDAAAGDAVVLDHPAGAAYCVPGTSIVVVSAGVLRALEEAEVAAVLAHEQAHLRARHDVVLLPFVVARRLLARVPGIRSAGESVALLVEMCADDDAARTHGPEVVHRALVRLGGAGSVAPPGTLAATVAVALRARRLATPVTPLRRSVRILLAVGGASVALTPLSQLLWPV
jgi:Zn-dependent protease with chaperone function